MMRRLTDIVYTQGENLTPKEQVPTSDEDIIKLQILTIEALEKDKTENKKRGLTVLHAMKYQGEEMIEYGEFIIKMADEEIDRYYAADLDEESKA